MTDSIVSAKPTQRHSDRTNATKLSSFLLIAWLCESATFNSWLARRETLTSLITSSRHDTKARITVRMTDENPRQRQHGKFEPRFLLETGGKTREP